MIKSAKYIIFLFCLINFNALQAQDWLWVNPLPTGNFLYDVKFLNKDTGFAVGEVGTIIKTIDAGKNWEVLKQITNKDLYAVCFGDNRTIYAVGDEGIIIKTENFGKNWEIKNKGIDGYYLNSVFFMDNKTGYTTGLSGGIFKTTDGGENWNLQLDSGEDFYSLYFTDKLRGFAIGDYGAMYETFNGGITWFFKPTEFTYGITSDEYELSSLCFPEKNIGYMIAYNLDQGYFNLAKTIDGGNNWFVQYKDTIVNDAKLSSILSFPDSNIGYSAGDKGFSKTIDGGKTWQTQDSMYIGNFALNAIYFIDKENGISVGGKIYTTTDGANNWDLQLKGTTTDLNSVYATDSNNVYAIGDEGAIINSTDGGKTWAKQNSSTSKTLNSVFFVNDSTGYIAASQGIFIKTTDKGKNWHLNQIASSSINFNSIYFTSRDIGYIAGSSYIYKTVDGGLNWNVSFHETGIYFNSVFFVNSNVGFAGGASNFGTVLKTLDGGKNWEKTNYNDDFYSRIMSIHFIDEYKGFVCTYMTFGLYFTIDAGQNWIDPKIINPGDISYISDIPGLNSIFFINDSIGFIVGEYGTILSSTDGGANWLANWGHENYLTTFNLNSIYFSDVNHGWTVGQYGTILKYTGKKDTGVYVVNNLKNKENFILYPNPADRNITIKSKKKIQKISIYNLTGKILLEKEIYSENLSINVQNLNKGLYIITITCKDETKSMKLIKN